MGLLIIPTFMTAANYSVRLQKGKINQKITIYDKDIWDITVNDTYGPEEFFGENANITGANGKYIVRSWYDDEVNTSALFLNLLIPREKIIAFFGPPYNQSYIDEKYNSTYKIGFILISKWNFISGAFPENASFPNDALYLLKNPEDFKTLLDDYNSFVDEVNNDLFFPITLSNYSIKEFLFRFFSIQMGILGPIDTYLTEMIDNLNSDNVSSIGNTLRLEEKDLDNYTIQISFGKMGLPSTITYLDEDGKVFYKITTYDTEWTVWLTLSIVGAAIIALVVYAFYKNWKRKKEFQTSLKRVQS